MLNKTQCLSLSKVCLAELPFLLGIPTEKSRYADKVIKLISCPYCTHQRKSMEAETEGKDRRGFFLAALHCSPGRREGRDGRRIFD